MWRLSCELIFTSPSNLLNILKFGKAKKMNSLLNEKSTSRSFYFLIKFLNEVLGHPV